MYHCVKCAGDESCAACKSRPEFIETVRIDTQTVADVYRLGGDECVADISRLPSEQEVWHTAMTSALDAANHPW